ncbi:MAG: glutamine amidotransferase [Myxococcota bacterium]|nr:glutamine amidotransferase [Myxococcota bacterium]
MAFVEFLVRYFAPQIQPELYNDWKLSLASAISTEARIAFAIFAIFAVVAAATGLSRLKIKHRFIVLTLRTLSALTILILILMPVIELRAVSKVRSRIAVYVDDSKSMSLATRKGTRLQAVQSHLSQNAATLNELSQRALVEKAYFSDRTRAVDTLLQPIDPKGKETNIAGLFSDLSQNSSGRDLGAVLIYSDGTDTTGLTVERATKLAKALEVPIYTFGFSGASSSADLAISRIVGDDFAFVHNTVAIDVDLEQRGLRLSSTMVSLKKDGQIVATKEAVFDATGKSRVSFEFKPREIGKLAYEVSVPVQEGEAVEINNSRSLVLKVIRDRIRVLQVAGRPSWDERFLRELLKRNPNIDLISFFILRTPTDTQRASQDELALIPFPVNELFTKELETFDVVIYQNFNYRPYRMAHYLRNIQEYVLGGGSFLMIGGDQSFDDGFYAGTPLASVLPVRLSGMRSWDPTEYRPRLTEQGRDHPITQIGEPGEPKESVFARLPKLAGSNVSLGLMPQAQALLAHPSLPGNPPIVSVRDVGKGRTMAVNTDSMWFWRFGAAADEGSGREFDRFWSQSLRWLIKDPELARVRLSTGRSVHAVGEDVKAEATVVGVDYRGTSNAVIETELIRQDPGEERVLKRMTTKTNDEGKAIVNLGRLEAGGYRLRTTAYQEGVKLGESEEPLVVEAAESELQAPFPRPDILKALAESSGGKYQEVSERLPKVSIKQPNRIEVNRTEQVPIWDTTLCLVLLIGLLGAEWWLRRRWGLL